MSQRISRSKLLTKSDEFPSNPGSSLTLPGRPDSPVSTTAGRRTRTVGSWGCASSTWSLAEVSVLGNKCQSQTRSRPHQVNAQDSKAGLGGPWSGGGSVQLPAKSLDQPLGCAVTPQPFSASHSGPHLWPRLLGPSLGSGSTQDRRPVSPWLPGLAHSAIPGAVGAGSGGAACPPSTFSGSTLARFTSPST